MPNVRILGSGTSVGVPVIGCDCRVCRSTDPRNQRSRASLLVRGRHGEFVIDTPPELRLQLTSARVEVVRGAVFTHAHADHIFGLDDLRICGFRLGKAIPLYCEERVEATIRQAYAYAFSKAPTSHPFAVPKFEMRRIRPGEAFSLAGEQVLPIRLLHGELPVLGFRVGGVAYCTDVNAIPTESRRYLEGLDVLILDALRYESHPTHYNLEQAIEEIRRLRPQRAVLTHLSHDFDHATTSAELPNGMELAWDGLELSADG